jgi:hypothetical protein
MLNFDPYSFGVERSLDQFERFAGICFADRSVDQDTINNVPPPSALAHTSRSVWRNELLRSHSRDISIDRSLMVDDDPTIFFGFFANAADGTELYRMDMDRQGIEECLASQAGQEISVLMAFFSKKLPARWTAWKGSERRGWLDRVDGEWPAPNGPELFQNQTVLDQSLTDV